MGVDVSMGLLYHKYFTGGNENSAGPQPAGPQPGPGAHMNLEEKVEVEQKKRTERFTKPNAVKKRKKKPGQKLGHVGMTRAIPDHIDEIDGMSGLSSLHHEFGM
jgi:hypothetical protein